MNWLALRSMRFHNFEAEPRVPLKSMCAPKGRRELSMKLLVGTRSELDCFLEVTERTL